MLTTQVITELEKTPGLIVEVRGQELISRKYADKTTGKQETFSYVAIAAECFSTGKQVSLEFFAAKGETPQTFPIVKGQKCFAWLKALDEQQGHMKAKISMIEPIEDNPGKKPHA